MSVKTFAFSCVFFITKMRLVFFGWPVQTIGKALAVDGIVD